MRRITVALPDETYSRFRVAAAEIESSMGAAARGLIIEWLKEEEHDETPTGGAEEPSGASSGA
jgi:plasmid stability protein